MEIDLVNEVGTKLINYFTSDSFKHLLSNINLFLIIYIIIFTISLVASLFYFYKKEGIKEWHALIPIYNLYEYFKLIKIPYYLVFIPIVNLITIYISGYKLAEAYRASKLIKVLSIIMPIVMIPYMIFSNKYELYKPRDVRYLKTVADVDKVEERLERESHKHTLYEESAIDDQIIDSSYHSKTDDKINTIEENAIQDDVEEQLLLMESNKEVKKVDVMEKEKEDIIDSTEIQDLFSDNDIRVNSIETIDNKIEEASNKKIIDNAEYKEYKEKEKDVSTIAFGGTSQNEKIENARMERKDTGLKCPHCGSDLAGSNGVCPGCGKDVSSLTFEKNNLTTVNIKEV